MIRAAIKAFIFDNRAPAVLDLACQSLPIDADLAARNERRIAEARERLGSRWICAAPINAAADLADWKAISTAGDDDGPPPQFERSELDAADLHPRLPAWMKAHAADERADLERAMRYLDADDRR